MSRTCETCRYWQPYNGNPPKDYVSGECRQRSPQTYFVNLGPADSGMGCDWPKTWGRDWCGEHMPKRALSEWRDTDIMDPYPSEEGA